MSKVVDIHAHVGSSAALYVGGSIQVVTSRMEKHGITHSVVSPIPGFEGPYGMESVNKMNQQVAEIQKANARIFPLVLGVAEARHGARAAVSETAYALGEHAMGGLMFHNDFAGVEIYAPVMEAILHEVMHYSHARVVQMHTAQHSMLEPPFGLWMMAKKFPDITFLCGHPMMSMVQLENMAAIVKDCPNIYVDTCCTWTHDHAIETFAEKVGSVDQIMFGSDNPYWHESFCMDKLLVEQADLSQEEKEKIFYKNFERVFGEVK